MTPPPPPKAEGRPVMAPWLEAVARAAGYPVAVTDEGPVLAIRWDLFTEDNRNGVWATAPSDPLRALLVLRPGRPFPGELARLLAGRLEVLVRSGLTAPSLPARWHPDARVVLDLLRGVARPVPDEANRTTWPGVVIPPQLLHPAGHHGDDTEATR